MFRGYVALLFLGGLAAVVVGTLGPAGGGSTLAMVGAASIGAALVLIGIVFLRDRDEVRSRTDPTRSGTDAAL